MALKAQQYQVLKAKATKALGTSLLIIREFHILVLTKRHVGSGNKIVLDPRALLFYAWQTARRALGNPWPILVPRGRAPFGQHQESRHLARSNDIPVWICKHNRLRPELIRFVRFDSEHAQSNRKSVNRGLPLLDTARGHDSWCWPKGARPLGTRMPLTKLFRYLLLVETKKARLIGQSATR